MSFDLLLGTTASDVQKGAIPRSADVTATKDGDSYTFTLPSGVEENTRYFWRMKATKGGLSTYSDVFTFRTKPISNTPPTFSGAHSPEPPENGSQHARVAVREEDGYRMMFAWTCSDGQSPLGELRFKLYFAKHIRYYRSSQGETRFRPYVEMPIRYLGEKNGMQWFLCEQAITPCRKGVPTGIWDTDESGQLVQLVGWEYGYWYVVADDGCASTESPQWIVEVLNEQGERNWY